MFLQTSFNIKTGSDEVVDLDLTPSGAWVAVTASHQLSFGGTIFPLSSPLWHPMVRAISDDLALVVGVVGSKSKDLPNGWIFDASGRVLSNFFAGHAIQDVLVSNRFIVISYFDESACYGGLEGNGVAVFDSVGNFQFGYRELFGEKAVEIADCYCTCWADKDRILFYPYTDFPVVSFDLLNKTQTIYDGPPETRGSGALSSRGDTVYFHSPYNDENGIFRWKVGEDNAVKVGSHSARLRGLTDGKFLAVSKTGYTIVSPE